MCVSHHHNPEKTCLSHKEFEFFFRFFNRRFFFFPRAQPKKKVKFSSNPSISMLRQLFGLTDELNDDAKRKFHELNGNTRTAFISTEIAVKEYFESICPIFQKVDCRPFQQWEKLPEVLSMLGIGSDNNDNQVALLVVHMNGTSHKEEAWNLLKCMIETTNPITAREDLLRVIVASHPPGTTNTYLFEEHIEKRRSTIPSYLVPKQSYEILHTQDIDIDRTPLYVVYQHATATRKDGIKTLTAGDIASEGCNLALLSYYFLKEIYFLLGGVKKYGA